MKPRSTIVLKSGFFLFLALSFSIAQDSAKDPNARDPKTGLTYRQLEMIRSRGLIGPGAAAERSTTRTGSQPKQLGNITKFAQDRVLVAQWYGMLTENDAPEGFGFLKLEVRTPGGSVRIINVRCMMRNGTLNGFAAFQSAQAKASSYCQFKDGSLHGLLASFENSGITFENWESGELKSSAKSEDEFDDNGLKYLTRLRGYQMKENWLDAHLGDVNAMLILGSILDGTNAVDGDVTIDGFTIKDPGNLRPGERRILNFPAALKYYQMAASTGDPQAKMRARVLGAKIEQMKTEEAAQTQLERQQEAMMIGAGLVLVPVAKFFGAWGRNIIDSFKRSGQLDREAAAAGLCTTCRGRGREHCDGDGYGKIENCNMCQGSGWRICRGCGGSGRP